MKILEIKNKCNDMIYTSDVIDAIHKLAAENGSTNEIEITCENGDFICKQGYSNRSYTKGYYAVLFLIDSCSLAYTSPGSRGWFRICLKSDTTIEQLYNFLVK